MIIRIGDERRHLIDEHLQKLKMQLNSAFVMKDKNNREAIIETLTTCIKHMPHKVNLYSYIIAALSLEDFDFVTLITNRVVQLLNESLVQTGDCFMSKNASRVLGNLAQYGLIGSETFC
jgi:hypothetical protein